MRVFKLVLLALPTITLAACAARAPSVPAYVGQAVVARSDFATLPEHEQRDRTRAGLQAGANYFYSRGMVEEGDYVMSKMPDVDRISVGVLSGWGLGVVHTAAMRRQSIDTTCISTGARIFSCSSSQY